MIVQSGSNIPFLISSILYLETKGLTTAKPKEKKNLTLKDHLKNTLKYLKI